MQRPRTSSGLGAAAQQSEEVRPKCYQGISRCRAEAGGQGKPSGDGKPVGPDRPLGKGVGGIKKERAERQGLGQSPNEKTRLWAVSPLWGNIVALSLPLYRGSKRDL